MATLTTSLFSWWLSGFDRRLENDGSRKDKIRRSIRTVLSVLVMDGIVWCGLAAGIHQDSSVVILVFALTALLIVLWVDCITEAVARLFVFLVDPVSRQKFEPNQVQQDLDRLAELVQRKHQQEAVALLLELESNHDISLQAAAEIRSRLGLEQAGTEQVITLTQALQQQRNGHFNAAEAGLIALLQKQPHNVEIAFALMRLYLRDLKDRAKAQAVLDNLAKNEHVARHYIQYAANSFEKWSQPIASQKAQVEAPVSSDESVEDLIKQKRFGSAIETLEKKLTTAPDNFELHFQLIELHGRYCSNFKQATKLAYQLKSNPVFTPRQLQLVMDKLAEWRAAAAL